MYSKSKHKRPLVNLSRAQLKRGTAQILEVSSVVPGIRISEPVKRNWNFGEFEGTNAFRNDRHVQQYDDNYQPVNENQKFSQVLEKLMNNAANYNRSPFDQRESFIMDGKNDQLHNNKNDDFDSTIRSSKRFKTELQMREKQKNFMLTNGDLNQQTQFVSVGRSVNRNMNHLPLPGHINTNFIQNSTTDTGGFPFSPHGEQYSRFPERTCIDKKPNNFNTAAEGYNNELAKRFPLPNPTAFTQNPNAVSAPESKKFTIPSPMKTPTPSRVSNFEPPIQFQFHNPNLNKNRNPLKNDSPNRSDYITPTSDSRRQNFKFKFYGDTRSEVSFGSQSPLKSPTPNKKPLDSKFNRLPFTNLNPRNSPKTPTPTRNDHQQQILKVSDAISANSNIFMRQVGEDGELPPAGFSFTSLVPLSDVSERPKPKPLFYGSGGVSLSLGVENWKFGGGGVETDASEYSFLRPGVNRNNGFGGRFGNQAPEFENWNQASGVLETESLEYSFSRPRMNRNSGFESQTSEFEDWNQSGGFLDAQTDKSFPKLDDWKYIDDTENFEDNNQISRTDWNENEYQEPNMTSCSNKQEWNDAKDEDIQFNNPIPELQVSDDIDDEDLANIAIKQESRTQQPNNQQDFQFQMNQEYEGGQVEYANQQNFADEHGNLDYVFTSQDYGVLENGGQNSGQGQSELLRNVDANGGYGGGNDGSYEVFDVGVGSAEMGIEALDLKSSGDVAE
ncbi:hypothetical protein HK098_007313 [Nowakowskiella sp. JEL0407]|nr:hypothetical protein HK098_007313 [Nowakowskiella sp. JEL0407]